MKNNSPSHIHLINCDGAVRLKRCRRLEHNPTTVQLLHIYDSLPPSNVNPVNAK